MAKPPAFGRAGGPGPHPTQVAVMADVFRKGFCIREALSQSSQKAYRGRPASISGSPKAVHAFIQDHYPGSAFVPQKW